MISPRSTSPRRRRALPRRVAAAAVALGLFAGGAAPSRAAASLPIAAPETGLEAPANDPIESLEPPPAAAVPVPADADAQIDADLQRKRQDRRRRRRETEPPPPTSAERRDRALLAETLAPHPRDFGIEIDALLVAALTHGAASGYTADPTSHFTVFWRPDQRSPSRAGAFCGLRVAPFAGTGLHAGRPGSYGLTYFGPMVGIGKIDPVTADSGRDGAGDTVKLPAANGWLLSGGLAALNKQGRHAGPDPEPVDSDFVSKGVVFDAPGIWIEARFWRIALGAAGYAVLAGAQVGHDRSFVYAGIGAVGLR